MKMKKVAPKEFDVQLIVSVEELAVLRNVLGSVKEKDFKGSFDLFDKIDDFTQSMHKDGEF